MPRERPPLLPAHSTPAQRVGCCLAPSKELCSRPPCPCNLDTYTGDELAAIRKAGRSS